MKRTNLINLAFVLSLISSIVFLGSCQQEEAFDAPNEKEVYLNLSLNADFDNLSKSDLEIISKAFFRLDLKKNQDGFYEIVQRSAEEVNVSDEIFDYFQSIAQNFNERILSDIRFTRNRLQTRSETASTSTDCVARSIAYATGQDYAKVNAWLIEKYGNKGVPADKFYEAMAHFAKGESIGISVFADMDIEIGSGNYVIVIGNSHAVNLKGKSGDAIMYWDEQQSKIDFCLVSDITHVYRIK